MQWTYTWSFSTWLLRVWCRNTGVVSARTWKTDRRSRTTTTTGSRTTWKRLKRIVLTILETFQVRRKNWTAFNTATHHINRTDLKSSVRLTHIVSMQKKRHIFNAPFAQCTSPKNLHNPPPPPRPPQCVRSI